MVMCFRGHRVCVWSALLVLAGSVMHSLWGAAVAPNGTDVEFAGPLQLAMAERELRERQKQISAKGIAYLWDQRMDAASGRIGKSQGRYLQALAYLALASGGDADSPEYRERIERVCESLLQPVADLETVSTDSLPKLFVGTSREFLAFETHAVVALAYEQLATQKHEDATLNQHFMRGAESAIEYVMEFRLRGRNYARAGGWPVNAAPYNRNRPDRRCTAWQLLLLKTHFYNGGAANSAAMREGPNFIFAAQRQAPELTDDLREAKHVHDEWKPRLRRGVDPPPDVRAKINDYMEYTRQLDESGGFGIDTIGIVSPSATAVGLFAMGLFDVPDENRHQAAVQAFVRMPMNWEAQRFFLTQFFATRGLYLYSQKYGTADFHTYMTRLLTLMEQHQDADGSFPLGSRGVEELSRMERVYTTAMCVLIANCNRGNLVFDRLPYSD